MKIKKTIVSFLSIAALTCSLSGMASAEELPKTNTEKIKLTLLGNTDVAYWNTDIKPNEEITLDYDFAFPSGYAHSLDGYQEAGNRGTPNITYSIHKITGPNSSIPVWDETDDKHNGYTRLSIPISKVDTSSKYLLKAKNNSKFSVSLRGNIISSSY
ncbi:hypothetical protein IE5_02247 [Bacillus cereus BAG3X2-2]|uniref:hypothetical protein n=1 Tax=Bacillus cereus TaxID=1396 RepID=UPI0002792752|nr:hypothetical protein [Bacillus cereus]EJQ21199.1 hypothetical protein IE5_02247 [Bacillus cereus BAG3X2-2]